MSRRPTAPKHLDDIARRKWRELVGSLPDRQPATRDQLAIYCAAWAAWIRAAADEDRIRWARLLRQTAGELELTPKHRKTAAPRGGSPALLQLVHKHRRAGG